jgi:hypothetical protein
VHSFIHSFIHSFDSTLSQTIAVILEHRYRQGRHPAAAYRVPWLFLSPCMMLACLPRNRFRRELGELRFKIHFSEVRRSCTPTSHLLYMARILDSAFPREDTGEGRPLCRCQITYSRVGQAPFHASNAIDKASCALPCMMVGEMHVADM